MGLLAVALAGCAGEHSTPAYVTPSYPLPAYSPYSMPRPTIIQRLCPSWRPGLSNDC